MDLKLKERVALVTGGSEGIGKAICLALAAEGVHVIACGRKANALERVCQEMRQLGVQANPLLVDATDENAVREGVQSVIPIFGRLDILVNNVGGAKPFGNFFELSNDDWRNVLELNLMSMVNFCRSTIAYLKQSDSGRIISIGSVPAKQPGRYNPHYSAAKAAVINLSKHLANLLAEDNILVNVVCPSTLRGGGWERNVKSKAFREGIEATEAERRMEEEEKKKNPLKRIGELQDVAQLVAFLASPCSQYTTGTCIDVDGGTVRSMV